MSQDEHLSLCFRQRGQRLAEGMRVLERRLLPAVFADPDLLNRDLPPRTDVIERGVARHPQDPGGERDLPLLVLLNGPHQLHEDVLRDVLGVVAVADDALSEPQHVIRVARIEIVQPIPTACFCRGDRSTLHVAPEVLLSRAGERFDPTGVRSHCVRLLVSEAAVNDPDARSLRSSC